MGVLRGGLPDAALGLRQSGESAHPDAVGPEEVAERPLDRAEEGAALAPALLVREPVRRAVEALVLPAIVARHQPDKGDVDHPGTSLERRRLALAGGLRQRPRFLDRPAKSVQYRRAFNLPRRQLPISDGPMIEPLRVGVAGLGTV